MASENIVERAARAEIWAEVGSHPAYEISSLGRIRRNGKFLRPTPAANGYLCVSLCRDGNCKTFAIHSLVAEAFLGRRPEGLQTAHQDGNRENNALDNLRYMTPKANTRQQAEHGTLCRGERSGHAILSEDDVLRIRSVYKSGHRKYGIRPLAKQFGISVSAMESAIKGKTWKHLPCLDTALSTPDAHHD